MAGTQVDIAGMQAATSKAEGIHEQMVGLLNRVNNTVAESSGVWKGTAQSAFMQVTAEYNEAASKMNNAMSEMLENLRGNMAQYQGSEESAEQSIKSSAGGLNLAQ
ncbi:MAG: WXG100 family type VII secretion target [Nocardiaceae bacterium]|nr:WXG100 family type VII secretion target [Nocardiaceae bacterium]